MKRLQLLVHVRVGVGLGHGRKLPLQPLLDRKRLVEPAQVAEHPGNHPPCDADRGRVALQGIVCTKGERGAEVASASSLRPASWSAMPRLLRRDASQRRAEGRLEAAASARPLSIPAIWSAGRASTIAIMWTAPIARSSRPATRARSNARP